MAERFFTGCRPSVYFHGARLKVDNKTGKRLWRMTFALTVKTADVVRCGPVIQKAYETIDTRENRVVKIEVDENIADMMARFYGLAESAAPLLALSRLLVESIALTRQENTVELWFTLEHENTSALHRFVGDYFATRLWAEFESMQLDLPGTADAAAGSAAVLEAVSRFADVCTRDGGAVTIETEGRSVTIDQESAQRIQERVKKAKGKA